jgi:hypothetical protein
MKKWMVNTILMAVASLLITFVSVKWNDIQSIPKLKEQLAREKKMRKENDSLQEIKNVEMNTKIYVQGKWIQRQMIIDSLKH